MEHKNHSYEKNLFLISWIFLISCSNSYIEDGIEKNNPTKMRAQHKIGKEKAIEIANSVLNYSNTTKGETIVPTFDYVFKNATKSNSEIPDTLAYIINYPNENGFVIVSGDNRVYPVLA